VEDAIDRVRVPAYVIDRHGIIRWLNPAARKLVGDVRAWVQNYTHLHDDPSRDLRGRLEECATSAVVRER
jgi:PAS domain-containing protein